MRHIQQNPGRIRKSVLATLNNASSLFVLI